MLSQHRLGDHRHPLGEVGQGLDLVGVEAVPLVVPASSASVLTENPSNPRSMMCRLAVAARSCRRCAQHGGP